MTKEIEGTLEVNITRGVIYFHSIQTLVPTVLRICHLPKDKNYLASFGDHLLDIAIADQNKEVAFL